MPSREAGMGCQDAVPWGRLRHPFTSCTFTHWKVVDFCGLCKKRSDSRCWVGVGIPTWNVAQQEFVKSAS